MTTITESDVEQVALEWLGGLVWRTDPTLSDRTTARLCRSAAY